MVDSMEFCPKCGKLLVPKKKGKTKKLVCLKCGYEEDLQETGSYEVSDEIEHKPTERLEVIEISEDNKPSEEELEERRERFIESIDLFDTE